MKYLLDLPDDLHREAKVRAAMDGITLKELLIKALKQYLDEKEES